MARKAQAAQIETPEPEQTSLAIFEITNPVAVLTDAAKFDAFYAKIKAETDAHVADVSTEKGRAAIKSLAFKVVKTKTAIDAEGARLTEEWRKNTLIVDKSRKAIRDRLDALRDSVRAPLTEWEAAEEKRLHRINTVIDNLRFLASVAFDATSDDVRRSIEITQGEEISEGEFRGHYEIAVAIRRSTIERLQAALGRIVRDEEARAELMQLRAEQEARLERERVEREAAEAEAALIARIAEEKAEADRLHARAIREAEERQAEIERAARAAEDAARARAEAEALAAQEAAERRHAEALAAERAAKDKAEREAADALEKERRAYQEALAEAERRSNEQAAWRARKEEEIAQREAERVAEAKRLADEQAARDKDRKHRGEVMKAAKEAIVGLGVSEEAAKKVVLAIVADEIPAVTLRF
jgi:colicin import membrane protein